MRLHKLTSGIFLSFCTMISFAQTGPAVQKGFVQFNTDGAAYGMNAGKDNNIKTSAELKYDGSASKLLVALYSKPDTRDTILIYLSDEKGLVASGDFSATAKYAFIYKLYGKGSMIKSLDNSKNETTKTNFIRLTKLEAKPGGTAEGVFSFTDIPFKSNNGKIVAMVKGISDGHFHAIITQYNEMPGSNNGNTSVIAGLNPVAKQLFKDVKCKLTDAEKNQIANLTGFILTGKKEQPFAMDKESMDYPYNAVVTITDMNKDGVEEVFIEFGNTYTSGNTGANIVLYIKDKQKGYNTNLGFPGISPEQLKTGYGGYPDLLIGGPGFEFPIWRWNGKEYVFYKTKKM